MTCGSGEITFGELTPLKSPTCISVATKDQEFINLQYIKLALGFVRDVLDAYENWNGKDNAPLKLQELIMVLQIEASYHRK